MGVHCRMDPVTDGNPIGWTIRTLGRKLPQMLERAGYKAIAASADMSAVRDILPEVEACARETFLAKRNVVKHNRGTEMFEAGNIRFGLEMRRLKNGDGGLAVHVLADIGGTPDKSYTEETELLAFDHFWQNPHYHYGPRNKNHRTNWDLTVIDDPLEWTFEQFETGKLRAMIERAGYPGVAADLDAEKIAAILPALKKRAFEMYEEGERLTGHKGLPLAIHPEPGRRRVVSPRRRWRARNPSTLRHRGDRLVTAPPPPRLTGTPEAPGLRAPSRRRASSNRSALRYAFNRVNSIRSCCARLPPMRSFWPGERRQRLDRRGEIARVRTPRSRAPVAAGRSRTGNARSRASSSI